MVAALVMTVGKLCEYIWEATSIDRGPTGNGLSSNGLLLTRVAIPLLPVGLEFFPRWESFSTDNTECYLICMKIGFSDMNLQRVTTLFMVVSVTYNLKLHCAVNFYCGSHCLSKKVKLVVWTIYNISIFT